ncbi:MAG: hypothetical protein GOMPHAMPRED_005049 [Gomphillus americanus]|uniref:Uncharacterized protein n=1 Tax=Gomphillus americanus TaxID=1940652 RepID=A0A8H3I8G8_9LECA|nr:MAG: hypothetical protein GOMPHAMPRED_005049 [Gomphillus americanus]
MCNVHPEISKALEPPPVGILFTLPSTSIFVVRSYRGRRCAAAEQRLRKVMFVELRVTKDPFADEASSLVVARSTADDLGEPDNLRKAPPQAEKGGAMFHFVFIVLE